MEKHEWFVISGKNPELTHAELESQLTYIVGHRWSTYSVTEGLVQINSKVPIWDQIDRLGGVIKAGEWLFETNENDLEEDLLKEILTHEGKINFGISVYGMGWSLQELHKLMLKLKKYLKEDQKSVRVYLPNAGVELSPVVVRKQLLRKGREFIIARSGRTVRIGETKWVHDFEAWAGREYGKPIVDKRRGMLPHKLARIMLNLTGLNLDDQVCIIDPFCGVGTVLIEAAELGCSFLGVDIDPKAVSASRENLSLKESNRAIWRADAAKFSLPKKYENGKIAIVTEPDLGPVWNGTPTPDKAREVVAGLTRFYSECLRHWRQLIPKGTPVVMVFPVIANYPTFAKIVDGLGDLEYSTNVKPIRYSRIGQVVQRDIVNLIAD